MRDWLNGTTSSCQELSASSILAFRSMYELHIDKLDNGFVLHGDELDEVIEFGDSENGEKEALAKLFHQIAEYFGIMYDGFSKENLNIQWNKKGDEVE